MKQKLRAQKMRRFVFMMSSSTLAASRQNDSAEDEKILLMGLLSNSFERDSSSLTPPIERQPIPGMAVHSLLATGDAG
jgi:hypothetical protein